MITALGTGKDINREKVWAGESGVKKITFFDPSRYRGQYGGEAAGFTETTVKNLRKTRLDRASHLLIHAAREAVTDAGIHNDMKYRDVLLSLGTTLGGMISGETFHKEVIKKGLKRARLSRTLDYLAQYQAVNLFKEFELRGDTVILSNACASGTNAIGHAFHVIRGGEFDLSICGGYDTMSEFTFAGFNALMAVSPTRCRPFDRDRDGLVLGEGAGILVLEELEHALDRNARIFCEVAGYGESADAYHMTSPDPSGVQASNAINRACAEAGPLSIDYLNAHGTATQFNDAMEAAAIKRSFGEKAGDMPVSSIKPMTGHLLGGAGAVEAIVSIFAINDNRLPPNLNFEKPDPECGLNIVTETSVYNIKTVLSNSFGFGGCNASIIFREYPWEN